MVEGSSEVKTCEIDSIELRAIRWFDSRVVTVFITYEVIQLSTKVKRWDQKNGQEIQVDFPSAVVTYNQNMECVGLLDGLLRYYRIPVKSKKWYHCLIWHFLEIAVVQGCLLQKRDTGNANLNLKTFKISVAMSLIKQGKSSSAKRARPSLSIEKA